MDGDPQSVLTPATAPGTSRRAGLFRRLRPLLVPALAALGGALLVLFVIRPDQGALPDAEGRTVAEEWYDSMSSVGG